MEDSRGSTAAVAGRLVAGAVALAGVWFVCSAVFGGTAAHAAEPDDGPIVSTLVSGSTVTDNVLSGASVAVDHALSGVTAAVQPVARALPGGDVFDAVPQLIKPITDTLSGGTVTTVMQLLLPVVPLPSSEVAGNEQAVSTAAVESVGTLGPSVSALVAQHPSSRSAVATPHGVAAAGESAVAAGQHPFRLPASDPLNFSQVALCSSSGTSSFGPAAGSGPALVPTHGASPIALAVRHGHPSDDAVPPPRGFGSDTTPD